MSKPIDRQTQAPCTSSATRTPGGISELGELPLERRQQAQAMIDTEARVSGGIFIYFTLWLIITWVTGLSAQLPTLVWSFAAWLGLVAVVRRILKRNFSRLAAQRPKFAHQALIWTVLANSISWGLMTAASVYRADLEIIRVPMIIVAVGVCSSGSMAMAIDSFLRFCFPIVLIIPVAIGATLNFNQSNLLFASLIFVYAIYTMISTGTVHRDYWRAMHASADLERASLTDALTKVANRMSFDRQYEREWRRSSRQTIGLAVVMVDLDFFKKINDTYGHQVGDLVLQHVARAIEEALLRGGDYVARYGGEEFVVLLPQTDLDGATAVVKRILTSVAAKTVSLDNNEVHVTCSIGYAWTHPEEGKRPDDLLKLADTALYAAKAAGRNQAHFGGSDGGTGPIKI